MINFNQAPKIENKSDEKKPQDLFLIAHQQASSIIVQEADRNREGKLLAYHGGPESNLSEENWKLVRTPAFKEWFMNSEIIDENGEPALMYHTTDEKLGEFDEFSDDKANKKREEKNEKAGSVMVESGFYFTAGNYEYGKNRLSVFLNAKIQEIKKHGDIMNLRNEEIEKSKNKGYTGLVHFFKDSEKEVEDLKNEYRKKHAPKSITDKIFYGFTKLKNWEYELQKLFGQDEKNEYIKGSAFNDLNDIKYESRKLRDIKKNTKSPFFEVCVFSGKQVMIVDKEEDYKNKL